MRYTRAMGYEDHILANIDRRRKQNLELPPTLEHAHEKAQRIFADPAYSIQETDFVGVYEEEAIRKDIERVRDMQRSNEVQSSPQERNIKKVADVLEGIVLTQSELSEWFGDATVLKSSLHDDYLNKVDMIAEWRTPQVSRVIGLAVDATSGIGAVDKKLREIRHEIDTGKLGMIRYFKDEQGNFKGTRYNVPRTVIGVSRPVIERLARLWIDGEKSALGADPVQRLLVTQIGSQLRAMRRYAENRDKPLIAQAYQEALLSIEPIEKEKASINMGDLAMDPVAQEIYLKTQSTFGS